MTAPLVTLEVLALDCQTTGARPPAAHLLEMAWCRTRADLPPSSLRVTAHLVQLPAGHEVPRRVSRLTGITTADTRGGLAPPELWRALRREIADPPLRVLIHYARFEEPFLQALPGSCALAEPGPAGPLPYSLLCSHEIARRLFPDLPRRTLRGLAGYLGHPLGELKRAADHVRATCAIWRHLVRLLEDRRGIRSIEELDAWLREPAPPRRPGARSFPMPRPHRLALPDEPGTYQMLGCDGAVLYVGKARSLRRRVNSYFQKRRGHAEHTWELLSQARGIQTSRSGSALEAALQEVDAIHRLDPPYNRALRTRERGIWFASADLSSLAPAPGPRHVTGPLPGADAVAILAWIPLLLNGCPADPVELARLAAVLLGAPPGEAPDEDCFRAGLGLLARRHGEAALATRGALRHLGARLWRQRLAECRQEKEETERGSPLEGPLDPQPAAERAWTPEAVLGRLEAAVAHASLHLRRAGWLLRLADATLAWRRPDGRGRLLVLRGGRVVEARDLEAGCPLAPERMARRLAAERPLAARLADLDLTTTDRLRALTTELRRLVAEEREVVLDLRPRARLDRGALGRLLPWI